MTDATARSLARVNRLVDGHTSRDEEAEVLQILSATGGSELDELVSRIDLGSLLASVDDHLGGPAHRTRLLQLLSQARVADLRVKTRADLVTALQRGRTSADEERVIADVFLSTRGADLTALKNEVDRGADHRDLHQLMFVDIDDAALRQRVIDHIRGEAAGHSVPAVKALSDIDDTFFENLKDRRYPRGTVYPGVIQYYAELLRGPGEPTGEQGHLVFLTARPQDRLGIVSRITRASLTDKRLTAEFGILEGDLRNVFGNERIAAKKVRNFHEYRSLFPEYGFVFTGDSGQGDPIVAETIRREAPADVRGTFIHDVVATPEERRAEQRARGVVFFDTYAGAGLEAFLAGLVTADGVRRVLDAARQGLAAIPFVDARQRQAREDDLARDAARIVARLA